MKPDTLNKLSIPDLHSALESGRLNCLAISEHCLQNRLIHEPTLQAYHQTNDKFFLQQAKLADNCWKSGQQSALTGIPCSLKNMFAAKGLKAYAGMAQALPSKWQVPGSIVNKLHAGFSPVAGLTHASELAFSGLGINPHWGTPRNPWDALDHRLPGGSSSGAAISVVCGSACFALGTDTGGSVRVPAAISGMVGLKTSTGRWKNDGIVPLSPRFDTVGVIARSVTDAEYVFKELDNKSYTHQAVGHSFCDFRVQLADTESTSLLDQDHAAIYHATVQELEKDGLKIDASTSSIFKKVAQLIKDGPNTAAIECSAFIATELPDQRSNLGRETDILISEAEKVFARDYLIRLFNLKAMLREAHQQMQSIDILISPTIEIPTPKLAEISGNASYIEKSGQMLKNTVVANLCGFCAITLPTGLDKNGMPTAIQFMAKNGEEEKLFAFATLAEKTLGTSIERLGKPPLVSQDP